MPKRAITEVESKESLAKSEYENAQDLLNAVHSTINEAGDLVSPAATFSCLVTLLRTETTDAATLVSVLKLLKVNVTRISPALLRCSSSHVLKSVERILRKNVTNTVLMRHGYQLVASIYRTFQPLDSKTIRRLQKLEPSKNHGDLIRGYLGIVYTIVENIAMDSEESIALMDEFLHYTSNILLTTEEKTSQLAGDILCTIFERCITAEVYREQSSRMLDLLGVIDSYANIEYSKKWSVTITVLAHVYDFIGQQRRTCHGFVPQPLQSKIEHFFQVLLNLHDIDYGGPLSNFVRNAMKAVAQCLTADRILTFIPITDLDRTLFRNKFVFDLLKKTVSHDSLSFYVTILLPLTKQFYQKHVDSQIEGKSAESQQWLSCSEKVWELASSFLRYPVDFSDATFRILAKSLIDASNQRELQKHVTRAFVTVCYCALNPVRNESMASILTRYTKNILPRLCNLYETEKSDRLACAIRAYAPVAEPSTMTYISKSITNGLQTESCDDRRSFLTVAICVAPYMPSTVAQEWCTIAIQTLGKKKDSDLNHHTNRSSLEKLYFRLLFELFRNSTSVDAIQSSDAGCIRREILEFLQQYRYENTCPPARRFRISIIEHTAECYIHEDSSSEPLRLAIQFTPELVAAVREDNTTTRENALSAIKWFTKHLGVEVYMKVVRDNMSHSDSAPSISGTLICLAKTFWTGHSALRSNPNKETIQKMYHTLLKFLISFISYNSKDVRGSALAFVRMILKLSTRDEVINDTVKDLMSSLLQACYSWIRTRGVVSCSTRQAVRVMFEKLLKRYGEDVIYTNAPEDSHRYVQYVSAMLRRRQRKREQSTGPNAKDRSKSDEHAKFGKMFFPTGTAHNTSQNELLTLRDEADGEDPIDLTDSGLLKYMTVVNASNRARNIHDVLDQDSDEEFTVRFDESTGKLIVAEKHTADVDAKGLALSGSGKCESAKSKRSRDEFDSEDIQPRQDGQLTNQRGLRMAHVVSPLKKTDRVNKRIKTMQGVHTGMQYATRKAKGDMKQKKSLDPYAYVPLDRRFLNKRYSRQSTERLKNVGAHKKKRK